MSNFGRTKDINKVSKSATNDAELVFFANAVSTRTHLFMLATLVIAALCSATFNTHAAQLSQPSNDLETQDLYQFLEAQISQSEIREASDALEQLILDIEDSQGRYAPELIQPLSLLGKAQMATQDYMQAVETFDRAIHLTRINSGLFAPEQVPLVYLQADAYVAMSDLRNAQQREEYAFQVLSNRSTRRELLAGMQRLGDFYLDTYNFLAARTLFRQGYEVLENNGFGNSDSAIPFLKGTASSYRMERFPPLYSQERRADELGRKPENTRNLEYSTEYLTINNFPAGERALQNIVKIRQSALSFRDENPDPKVVQNDQALVNQALLDLADWHLLFSNQKRARTLYSEIHRQQAQFPTELKIDLSLPELLYLPAPQNLKPPPAADRLPMETGSITLEFSIQKNGRIRGLETIAYEPNDAIEFHARRSIRQAIYRPAMVEGEATVTPAHRYVHTYPYFPSRKARAKEQEALEQQTDPETEPAPVPDLELEQEQQADQPANDENDKQKSAANFRGTIIESANANNA
jgi:hypothetical protein